MEYLYAHRGGSLTQPVLEGIRNDVAADTADQLCNTKTRRGNTMLALSLLVVSILLYFLPSIIGKDKKNAIAIFALNLFAGWTVIGWIGALVWPLTVEER